MPIHGSRRALCFTLIAGLAAGGCDDDGGSGSEGSATDAATTSDGTGSGGDTGSTDEGGASGETGELPTCADGCRRAFVLGCENGPVDQALCEADCEMLLAGRCGSEYEAWQRCGGAMAELACDDQGYVVIVGCETEHQAFLTCLNG